MRPYIASYVGDMFPGVSVVYGEGNLGCTYDFIYGANVALFWGCNPNTSRIPDAHYLWEGKYNGAKVIVVTPEFNSTAIHADLWVPVKPGYDGHLALSILHRIVHAQLYDEAFLKQFTDLPLLVRTDTKELVRLADVDLADPRFDARSAELFAADEAKRHEVFLAFDRKRKKITALPGCEGSTRRHAAPRGHRLVPSTPLCRGSWRAAASRTARRGGGRPRLRALRSGAGGLRAGEGRRPSPACTRPSSTRWRGTSPGRGWP